MTPLPPLLVLTDRRACERRGRSLAETAGEAVTGGARAFVLREKDLPTAGRRELGTALLGLLAPVGGLLLIASDAALAGALGTAWVHLASDDPWPSRAAGLRAGRSCHGAASLARARDQGATYATLSPVFASPSKPGYGPPLGLAGLAGLIDSVPDLPVYALGGVDPTTAAACRTAGAAGVAVMGAVMGAAEPAAATHALLAAMDQRATR